MRFLSFLAVSFFLASSAQGDGIATSTRLVSVQTYQTANIKVAVRGFADELATIATEGDGSLVLQIPGYLYVESKERPQDRSFRNYRDMIDYVTTTYCVAGHRPRGEVFFRSSKYPELLLPVVVTQDGDLSHISKNFNIKVGYGEGNREVVIYEDITCML